MIIQSLGNGFIGSRDRSLYLWNVLNRAVGKIDFVALAACSQRGWLHVNADWFILETVDEQMNPIPPGQPSHSVLLTNLINRVQPIIRCNLGGRITVSPDACPCDPQ